MLGYNYLVILGLVIFAYLFSLLVTSMTVSPMKKMGARESNYMRLIGKSRYQPPSWVFGVVWLFIFTGLLVVWCYLTAKAERKGLPPNSEVVQRLHFHFLVIFAVLVKWSFWVLIGELIGGQGIVVAHLLSTAVLLFGAVWVFYTLAVFHGSECEKGLSDVLIRGGVGWVEVGITAWLVVFGAWLSIASFLSVDVLVRKLASSSP